MRVWVAEVESKDEKGEWGWTVLGTYECPREAEIYLEGVREGVRVGLGLTVEEAAGGVETRLTPCDLPGGRLTRGRLPDGRPVLGRVRGK